jgi:hypothetical protein
VIKAAGMLGGKPMLILGLSGENMTRLMAGEPIMLDTAALGLPEMTVVVCGGRTEVAITAELRVHGLLPAEGST